MQVQTAAKTISKSTTLEPDEATRPTTILAQELPTLEVKTSLSEEKAKLLICVYEPAIEKRRGDQLFFYPIVRPYMEGQSASKEKEVEIASIRFGRGTNLLINSQAWNAAFNHPPNKAEIERLMKKGVIRMYYPDSEQISGSTTDFKDMDAIKDIVENCSDKNWLERCRSRDPRPEVDRVINRRLDELQDDMRVRSNWTSASVS